MKTLTSTEEYDLLVLGSGGGGKVLAATLAQKGQRAADARSGNGPDVNVG